MAIQMMPNLTESDGLTPQAAVGDIYTEGGNTYVYCLATAAPIKAFAACSGASPATVQEATTTTATALGTGGGFACVPQFAVAASEYFWAVVETLLGVNWKGDSIRVFAENATAGAYMYTTATAGNLDDASAGSTIPLLGMVMTSTTTTAAATKFTTFRRLGWNR